MPRSAGAVALDIVMGKNTVADVVKQSMDDCKNIIGDSSADIGQKVSSIGVGMKSIGGALAPVSTAVSAVGKSVVQTTADFDSAMAKVSAISGSTGDDLEILRDKAKQMGESTKFSATQSAEAFTYMAMAGWKTEDMLDGISGVMNLAAASGEDLATTSDIVTDALTAFGLQASDAGHFADVLAAASSNANTNVSMMGETFKYVAPVAGSLGYSVEDMSVAIGLMANSGIKGSQAGTALRSTITRLTKPTDESAAAMEALGLSITNSDGSMKSFMEIMLDMREGFAGLTEAEQANIAAKLAGQEAMSGLLAIVNASDADFKKLTSSVNGADGAAEKMANTMNDNLNGQLTLLKSQLEGIAINLGEMLVPFIQDTVSNISNLVTKFAALDDGTKKVILTVAGIVAVASPVLIIMGKTIDSVGKIITGVTKFVGFITGSVVPALSSFFSFLIANPIALVIAGIVAAGVLLVTHWEEVKAVAQAVWEGIKGIIEFAWEAIKIIIQVAMEFISALITSAWEIIMGIFTTVLNIIVSLVTMVWNTICTVIQTVMSIISDIISTAWNAIYSIISGILNAIYSVVSSIWNAISSFITSIVTGIKNTAVNIFTSLKDGISTIIGNVKDTIVDGLNAAFDFIKGIPSQAIQWGKDMIQGLIDGIKSMIGAVGDAVKGVADKITGWLHFSRPDEGPLREYESWMPDFMGGLAKGIYDNEDLVTGALKDLTGKMSLNPSLQLNGVGLKEVGRVDQRTNENKVEQLLEAILEWLKNHPDPDGDNSPATIYLGGEFIGDYIDNRKTRNTIRSGGYA